MNAKPILNAANRPDQQATDMQELLPLDESQLALVGGGLDDVPSWP